LYCASCGKLLVTPPSQTEAATAAPPQAAVAVEYMGFWIRLVAAIVDGIITAIIQGMVVSAPFRAAGQEGDGDAWFGLTYLIGMAAGWAYHVLFIGLKGATPGKMLLGMRVVDRQGGRPSLGTAFVREVPGKIVSGLVLGLGYIWVAFDGRKQGWHDKMAGTYVVRAKNQG
jgi:uncharacterized RDD family membrane protein YckC